MSAAMARWSVQGVAVTLLLLLSMLLAGTSGASAAPGSQPTSLSLATTRYAQIRRVCPPATPG